MATNLALVRRSEVNPPEVQNGSPAKSSSAEGKQSARVPMLTDEVVEQLLAGRGVRGWLRATRVAQILGLFSLYLFLDTYNSRADFNRRAVDRLREKSRSLGVAARFRARARNRAATPRVKDMSGSVAKGRRCKYVSI